MMERKGRNTPVLFTLLKGKYDGKERKNTPVLFTLLKGKYDGKERKDYPCTIYSTERKV